MTHDKIKKLAFKINMILQMRFGDGTGQDLQVKLAQKEIEAEISQALSSLRSEVLREVEGIIGEDDTIGSSELKHTCDLCGNESFIEGRNEFRAELRAKLSELEDKGK